MAMTQAPRSSPLRGILLMMGALALFALLDTLSKGLTASHPVPVIVWGRYAVHFLITLLVFMPRHGLGLFRSHRPGLQVLRGLMLVMTTALVVLSFRQLPVAEVTALIFVTPLLVTVLAVKFLGERMLPLQWLAIGVGFCGVLLIVRPSGALMGSGALLVLAAAGCYSVYQVLTRKLSAGDHSATQLLYTALVGTVAMSIVLPWHGLPVSLGLVDALQIGSLGLIAAVSHLLLIMAFRAAPATTLSPFSYAQLAWATLFGWIAFGDLPDGASSAGMGIIAASGLGVAYLERRKREESVRE